MSGTSYAEIPFTIIKISLAEGQASIKTMALSSKNLGFHQQPCHEGTKVDVQSLIRGAFKRQDLYTFFGEVSALVGQDNRHILLNDMKPGITCNNRYYKNLQVIFDALTLWPIYVFAFILGTSVSSYSVQNGCRSPRGYRVQPISKTGCQP